MNLEEELSPFEYNLYEGIYHYIKEHITGSISMKSAEVYELTKPFKLIPCDYDILEIFNQWK
jgi:hypothetical protein